MDRDRLPGGVHILGNGFVGGKAVGLIFTAAAVESQGVRLSDFPELIAFPDSTIVATDHFDNFMIENRLREAVQEKCDHAISKVQMAQMFMASPLPSELTGELRPLLGRERRPLAVRSSSFMEDNLKHSFAGVYQSFFIPNRGSDRGRLQQLETAIKLVYMSTFGDNAREYRLRHDLNWREEKMGVLIQNLIGREHEDGLYYPLVAGVGFSRNYYPWTDAVPTGSGVARIVMGLGTRAVGRYYARVFSPAAPLLRPEGGSVREVLQYSQGEIDVLDLDTGVLRSPTLDDVKGFNDRIQDVTSELKEGSYFMDAPRTIGEDTKLVLTFDPMLKGGRGFPLVGLMRSVLRDLEALFKMPVDMEFAADVEGDGLFHIVQVRPLGGRAEHRTVSIPRKLAARDVILRSRNVLGNGAKLGLRTVVYVPLDEYRFDRGHEIARQVGAVNASLDPQGYVLMGPGRWATSHPELGVPVTYAEISHAEVIVECSHGSFTPELSYGTHFFGDMLVSNILYIPAFLEKGDYLNTGLLSKAPRAREGSPVRVLTLKEGVDVYADGRSRTGVIVARRSARSKRWQDE